MEERVAERTTGDTSTRVGAFVAAALLHLPLILATSSRERPESTARSLRVRFIAQASDVAMTQRATPVIEDIQPTTRRASAPRSPPMDMDPPVPTPPNLIERTDWYLQSELASKAAIDGIIREEAYRSIGPREKRHQIVEPKPPPPLFREPKHRPGDIAPNAMDLNSVWHSEHCFTQLERPTIPYLPKGPGDLSGTNPVKCMFPLGKAEPRGDLFEHLKKERDKAPLPGESARTR